MFNILFFLWFQVQSLLKAHTISNKLVLKVSALKEKKSVHFFVVSGIVPLKFKIYIAHKYIPVNKLVKGGPVVVHLELAHANIRPTRKQLGQANDKVNFLLDQWLLLV